MRSKHVRLSSDEHSAIAKLSAQISRSIGDLVSLAVRRFVADVSARRLSLETINQAVIKSKGATK